MNEEDQLRIISMEMGGDVKGVFSRLARGIQAVEDSVRKESGRFELLCQSQAFVNISIFLVGSSCSTPSTASSTLAQLTLVLE